MQNNIWEFEKQQAVQVVFKEYSVISGSGGNNIVLIFRAHSSVSKVGLNKVRLCQHRPAGAAAATALIGFCDF